jgi:hypothetical protein
MPESGRVWFIGIATDRFAELTMKFNFWQILGAILLIGGAAWFIWNEMKAKNPQPQPNPPAQTQPR